MATLGSRGGNLLAALVTLACPMPDRGKRQGEASYAKTVEAHAKTVEATRETVEQAAQAAHAARVAAKTPTTGSVKAMHLVSLEDVAAGYGLTPAEARVLRAGKNAPTAMLATLAAWQAATVEAAPEVKAPRKRGAKTKR